MTTLTVGFFLLFLAPAIWRLPDLIVEFPRMIGSLAIVFFFLIFLAWHLSALSEFGDRSGYPVLGLMAALSLGLSYLI